MTTTNHDRHTVLPPVDLEGMLDLSAFLQGITEPAALVGLDGQTAPGDQLLTAQEAANFLGISRPTLVKQLENGRIPSEKTTGGRHRRARPLRRSPEDGSQDGEGRRLSVSRFSAVLKSRKKLNERLIIRHVPRGIQK